MRNEYSLKQDCPRCGVTGLRLGNSIVQPVKEPLLTADIADLSQERPKYRTVFIPHECLLSDMHEHQHRVEELIPLIQELKDARKGATQTTLDAAHQQSRQTRDQITQLMYDHGLVRDCPKCDVEAGERCHNLTARKRTGEMLYTKKPHEERLPITEQAEIPQLQVLLERYLETHQLITQITDRLELPTLIHKLQRVVGIK